MLEETGKQPEAPRGEATVNLGAIAVGPSAAQTKSTAEQVFSVSNLDVSYGGKLALKGVDMTIYRNQITAFIGPSGCGKST